MTLVDFCRQVVPGIYVASIAMLYVSRNDTNRVTRVCRRVVWAGVIGMTPLGPILLAGAP